jgi:hypothetical protein
MEASFHRYMASDRFNAGGAEFQRRPDDSEGLAARAEVVRRSGIDRHQQQKCCGKTGKYELATIAHEQEPLVESRRCPLVVSRSGKARAAKVDVITGPAYV